MRRHVFWYTTPDEIQLLYRDYRLLVKRSGNFPPLNVVEANILEVHRRIHLLRHEAATRIQVIRGSGTAVVVSRFVVYVKLSPTCCSRTVMQSCVRGLLARHYVRLVCSQRAAAETRRVRAAIAIQCAIRRLFGVRKVARRSVLCHFVTARLRDSVAGFQ